MHEGTNGGTNGRVRGSLLAAIADHGPIAFPEFMELALYSPGGFYDRPPVGEQGHFVTSPHVHPVFAELLSHGLRELWRCMGSPEPLRLVEIGAGAGTLARQLLDALSDLPIEFTAVERTSGARRKLAELPVRVASSLDVIDRATTGIVIANEVLDNLPFH